MGCASSSTGDSLRIENFLRERLMGNFRGSPYFMSYGGGQFDHFFLDLWSDWRLGLGAWVFNPGTRGKFPPSFFLFSHFFGSSFRFLGGIPPIGFPGGPFN